MTGTTGTDHRVQQVHERRPRPSIGLRVLEVPPIPATAVRDCLTRLPARQDVDRVAGRLLWLPRLGVTVLPHDPVTGGWVCTLVGVDGGSPGWVPVGAFVIADLEIQSAISTRSPWQPVADLTSSEFLDAWRVRYAAHRSSVMLGEALLAATDPDSLTFDTAAPAPRARSGARTRQGLAQACRNLGEAGLLLVLFDEATPDPARGPSSERLSCSDPGGDGSRGDPGGARAGAGSPRRYGLVLPAAACPASWRLR